VNSGHVLETNLGYFMTPLLNVLLGAVFLRERLTKAQLAAVLLAAAALLYLTIDLGHAPWVALLLCLTFGFYGLFRKVSGAAPAPGLLIETTLLLPLALLYLAHLRTTGATQFGLTNPRISLLLMSTGIVTGVPLIWFAHAARHLRLTTLGFLQYLSPSCTLLLGVFVYHEPFRLAQLLTFILIWIALAIFTVNALRRWRASKSSALQPVEM
jgi:chloramphenicol-sensitive protein RarD